MPTRTKIETLHFLATKCNIHVVVCRFFECAEGVFKGGARWVCEAPAGSLCSRAAQKYGIQCIKCITSAKKANTIVTMKHTLKIFLNAKRGN